MSGLTKVVRGGAAFVSLLTFVTMFLPAIASAAEKRPNIILILSDNQSSRLIGAYGNAEIRTPHIDRLASEGVLFRNAFSSNGVCSPTRATLLTGLMPSQTGVHVALPGQPALEGWSAIEEFRNLPQTLADAGYETGLVGKYHLGRHEQPQLGFSYWVTFPSGHTTTFYDQTIIDNGDTYVVKEHLTDFWTEKAIEFIKARGNKSGENSNGPDGKKPFFLYLSYNGPYMLPPTVLMEPNNRFAEEYAANPPSMPQDPIHPYLEAWAQGRGPTGEMVKEGTTAWSAIRALNNKTAMVNTASETAMVDDGVGQLMAALAEQGLDEETLVIYTSDQGARYGHGGLWGNTSWSFPFTAHGANMEIPLIVRHAGQIAPGQTVDAFINQTDFFPTLLAYLGMEDREVPNSSGKDFTPLLAGESPDWENEAYFEFVTVRVIRTTRWSFMKRFDRQYPDALYDLQNDPEEHVNLIDDPAFAEIRDRLDSRLTVYFDTFSDPAYDLWKGGTAKAQLLDKHYGRNDVFRDRFPNWREPFVEKAATPYRDTSVER